MRLKFAWMPTVFLLALGTVAYLGCKPSENATPTAENAQPVGHQNSGGQQPANNITASTPDAAVLTFLNAVRSGDDQTAASLLTTTARTAMQEAEMYVQPPGSPNAQFNIGAVKLMPEHGGAHVDSTWTDIVENGEQRSYEITWILRRESDSWRVAGMSTELFPNQPRLVLNFENPADMQQQVMAANEEMERQNGEGEIRQATLPPEQGGAPLR